MEQEIPMKGWLWSMFKEYVRKIRRTASTGAPALKVMQAKYQSIYPEASVKILVEEKVGMIVVFNDLESRTTAELDGLMEIDQLMAYLTEKYGRGKYKINLYHGMTFVATQNFRVEDESLQELWRPMVEKSKAAEETGKGRWG